MPPEQPQEPTAPIANEPASVGKKSPISTPAAILTGAVVVALAIVFTFAPHSLVQKPTTTDTGEDSGQPASVPADVAKIRSGDYVRGDTTAPVVVIEYSDSDCPFCQQFHKTMQQAMNDYKGKIAWVYRFYPLTSLHPNAYTEALALSCVGELGGSEKFWPYLDTLINVTLAADPKSNEALVTFATSNGIDATLLKTCMKNSASTAPIDAGIAEAQKIGAKGTPFSVAINQSTGKQVIIPGAVPYDYLKQELDSLIK